MTLNKINNLVYTLMDSREFSSAKVCALQTIQELLKESRPVGRYIAPTSDCRKSEVLIARTILELLPEDKEVA